MNIKMLSLLLLIGATSSITLNAFDSRGVYEGKIELKATPWGTSRIIDFYDSTEIIRPLAELP